MKSEANNADVKENGPRKNVKVKEIRIDQVEFISAQPSTPSFA